jgi:BlaI family transcriptional regulator, penicillinase repressor
MSQQSRTVTETEFAILSVLWDRGPTTVRGIVEAMYRDHTHSRHAGVKSLLERLAEKQLVACERREGVHYFSALVERETFAAWQLQQLADSAFGGSLAPLLSTLVEKVKLTRADRETIRKIIDKID